MRWRTSWYTSRRRPAGRRTPRRAGRWAARRRSSRWRAAPLAARTSGRWSSRRRAPRRRPTGRGPTRWSPHGVLWLSRRRRSGQLSRRRRSDGPGQPWLARLLSAGQPSRSQRNSGHGRLSSVRDRTKSVQAATMACPGVRAEKLSSQRLSSRLSWRWRRPKNKRERRNIRPQRVLGEVGGCKQGNDENPRATKSSANLASMVCDSCSFSGASEDRAAFSKSWSDCASCSCTCCGLKR